jgi:restriction system protein
LEFNVIPDFQSAMLPILQKLSDNKIYDSSGIRFYIIEQFSITDEEQLQKTPNGKQFLLFNRVAWSISYLRTAGLIYSPQRGRYQISDIGKKLLKNPPSKITIKFLKGINSENIAASPKSKEINGDGESGESIEKTPDEMMEEGLERINYELSRMLLKNLEEISPTKFEKIVVDLLIKMGYGGSDFENGEVTQKSADEGIDGIIKEDKLGLDKIYIQAKHWKQESSKIGRPEIQKFVGALDGQRAKKGVFITTALFSKEATEYAEKTNFAIVLIDGKRLTKLMIDYEVGITIKDIYKIGKIDTDYFIEE